MYVNAIDELGNACSSEILFQGMPQASQLTNWESFQFIKYILFLCKRKFSFLRVVIRGGMRIGGMCVSA